MTIRRFNVGKIIGFCVSIIFSANLLGACTDQRSWDYRVNNPLVVSEQNIHLALLIPPKNKEFSKEAGAKLNEFMKGYIDRSRGILQIKVAPISDNARLNEERVTKIWRFLQSYGIPDNEFNILVSDTADTDSVLLSYVQYQISVPTCETVASKSMFESSNNNISYFGCAYQKALGSTIARPGDYLKARTTTNDFTSRRVGVIKQYQAGQPTGAVKSAEQTRTAPSTSTSP